MCKNLRSGKQSLQNCHVENIFLKKYVYIIILKGIFIIIQITLKCFKLLKFYKYKLSFYNF